MQGMDVASPLMDWVIAVMAPGTKAVVRFGVRRVILVRNYVKPHPLIGSGATKLEIKKYGR